MNNDEREKAIVEAVERCTLLEEQVSNLRTDNEDLKAAIDNMVAILCRATAQMADSLPTAAESQVVEMKSGRIHIIRPWRKR